MVNILHDINPGEKMPEEFITVVETTKGSRNKYEIDKETGLIALDRVLYSPFHYPFDYGFIPQTHWDDGDAVDVLLVVQDSTFPGCMVPSRPIGVMYMVDSGENDEKIVAVPVKDPRMAHIKSLDDLGEHFQKEVAHFFEHYKDLQGKKVTVKGWGSKAEAVKVIKKGMQMYKDKYKK